MIENMRKRNKINKHEHVIMRVREFGVSSFKDVIWVLIEKTVYAILKLGFKVMKKDLTNEILEAFMQFAKFGIVGLSNTVLSYVLYAVGVLMFRRFGILPDSGYLVAQAIAFVISVLWSFYWNSKAVFTLNDGSGRAVFKALVKTFIAYSFTGLLLSSALLVLWVRILHISDLVAPFINLIVTVPLNFVINKLWTFK